MKDLFRILLCMLALAGLCSCESDMPDRSPSLSERFEKGFRGEGSLFIRTKESGDSFASPDSSR
jgi:hypothetical protein